MILNQLNQLFNLIQTSLFAKTLQNLFYWIKLSDKLCEKYFHVLMLFMILLARVLILFMSLTEQTSSSLIKHVNLPLGPVLLGRYMQEIH